MLKTVLVSVAVMLWWMNAVNVVVTVYQMVNVTVMVMPVWMSVVYVMVVALKKVSIVMVYRLILYIINLLNRHFITSIQ